MKLIGKNTRKVGCAAHGCRRIATYRLFMPARADNQGRKHDAYNVYACAAHTGHYQRYAESFSQVDGGFIIQPAPTHTICHF